EEETGREEVAAARQDGPGTGPDASKGPRGSPRGPFEARSVLSGPGPLAPRDVRSLAHDDVLRVDEPPHRRGHRVDDLRDVAGLHDRAGVLVRGEGLAQRGGGATGGQAHHAGAVDRELL